MQYLKTKHGLYATTVLLCILFIFTISRSDAQCLTNSLNNPSFESPVVSTINGNNHVGSSWSGWSSQWGTVLNIIRVNGSNYGPGADNAAQGTQYLDIAGPDDYPIQTFTISAPSICYFSGKFSNRETVPGFVDWTAKVEILNSSNTIVASSNSKLMTNSVSTENWYMMAGESGILGPGTYKYRAFLGDFGHFDDAFLCVQTVSTMCANRIPEANFESPVQSSNNTAISVGTSSNGMYTKNGSNILLTKVNGAGYSLGPDVAIKGSQYASVSGTNDFLLRDFSITCPTTVNFSGYFASRPNATYANWTGIIDILNSSNAVVASSGMKAFTASTPKDIWYQVSGSSPTLAVGNYKYRVLLGREGNFDDGYFCVTAVSCAVLPVSLKTFTATKGLLGALITWTTAQEQNNLNFIIQHSADGINWQNVGTVGGAGISSGEKTYNFLHKEVLNGSNYYRLQQNDVGGAASFSDVKLLKYRTDQSIFSVQQPVFGSRLLHINLGSNQTLMIYSGDGKLIHQKNYNAGLHSIDMDKYSSGIYLLSNGQQTERFLLQ